MEIMSSSSYAAAIDSGLSASLKWLEDNKIESLPDSVWDCPKGCPIWEMNLSLAQAGGIYGAMKRALKDKFPSKDLESQP